MKKQMNNFFPQKCNMPDLSDIKLSAVSVYLANSLTGGSKNINEEVELYRRNFVRLVDKSIIEYMEVREAVENQISGKNGELFIVSIINHLENCINSVKRSLNFLGKIRRHKETIPLGKFELKYLSKHRELLKDIRNVVEHADDDIQKGLVVKGKPIAISISEDASVISLFDYSISSNDLGIILRKLHLLSLDIARYRIEK